MSEGLSLTSVCAGIHSLSKPMDPVAHVPAGDARKKENNRDGSEVSTWTQLPQPILKSFHGFTSQD
jgi:hypothetical protein